MKVLQNTLITLCSGMLLSSGVTAAEIGGDYTPRLCPTSLNIPDRPYVDVELEPGDTHMGSDEAELIDGGVSTLTGNAEVTRDSQQVTADLIEYNQPGETADLKGNINYWDDTLFLKSDEAHLQFDDGVGEFTNADYVLKDSRARGTANKLVLDVGTRTDMEGVEYTTCDPDDEFWKLTSSKISLDHENNQGTARNVVLRIKDFPVFYTPYLSFPLSEERKSGFLAPSYGDTNRHGFEARTPYYWNINPNMDATITPRILSRNGVMAMGEYRYLASRGSGVINLEYLPGDSTRGNDHRSLFGTKFNQDFARSGNLNVNYNRVSDKFYFEDFGSQISVTSTRFIEQRADIGYSGQNWKILTRVQNYQTVDRSLAATSRPYKRLPQILFNYQILKENNRINYGIDSEAVYFQRDGSNPLLTNVNGLRLDLNPYISYRSANLSYFIEPKLKLRYTQYNLDNNSSFSSSPGRVLPVLSLDSGVFLERNINLFDNEVLQTLEPRIYYLYVPYEDQSDLPVFDTGLYTFSFDSLFRAARFSNADRVGDANQITLAITSNHISSSTGRNLGYVRLGQIFYLEDRKVTLTPSGSILTEGRSPIVTQFGLSPLKHLQLLGNFQWDPNGNGTEKFTSSITYNPAPGKVLNLAYRNHFGVDQTDLSFRWPFKRNWNVVGRWNYTIPEGRSLETFGGIEYDSCCFGVRAVTRRFLSSVDGQYDTGVFLKIELKGLAGIGKKTVDFLKQQIPGYQSEF